MRLPFRAFSIVAESLVALAIGSASFAQSSTTATSNPSGNGETRVADTANVNEIETVTVTARRRAENQQNVPIAITAFSAADLAARETQRPQDLINAVPSLNVFGQNRDDAEITLRGQGPGTINPGQRPVAGAQAYFAEVPTLTTGPGIFYDLQSVQVLKGPQGTLFGRNTTGGAVLYEPAAPVDNFEASAKISAGDYGMQEYEGMVNVPVIDDQLLLRVAGDVARRDGFTQSVVTGQHQDSVDYNAYRVSLAWRPTENFENTLIYDGRNIGNSGTSEILRQVNPTAKVAELPIGSPPLWLYIGGSRPGIACLLSPTAACQAAYGPPSSYYGNVLAAAHNAGGFSAFPNPALQNALAQQQALGIRKDTIPFQTGYKELAEGLTNTTVWNVTDDLLVKNIFGYRLVNSNQSTDFAGTSLSIVNIVGGLGSQEQLTEEMQIQDSFDSTFKWIAGAYYEEATPSRQQIIPNIAFGETATEFPSYRDDSIAGFLHVEKDLSSWFDGLKVSGGIRYTSDSRKLSESTTGANPSPLAIETGQFGALTWDATVEYHPDDNIMTYITGRRGYKTGGFNLPAPTPAQQTFGPEHLYDIEAGLKGDWNLGDIPLRTNADVFQDWYDNIQLELPAVTSGTLETVTQNAGRGTISGLEFEGTIVPVTDVQLTASGSIDDTRYSTESCNSKYRTCGEFPWVPEDKFGGTAAWQLPLPPDIGAVKLAADYSWIDKAWTSDRVAPLHNYPSYGLLNLRVDWQMFDWGVTASAFVTNATDKTYILGGYPLYSLVGFESVIYGAPRMYGFSLAYKFGG
jgi:iron complex outermembrane receptor protein